MIQQAFVSTDKIDAEVSPPGTSGTMEARSAMGARKARDMMVRIFLKT